MGPSEVVWIPGGRHVMASDSRVSESNDATKSEQALKRPDAPSDRPQLDTATGPAATETPQGGGNGPTPPSPPPSDTPPPATASSFWGAHRFLWFKAVPSWLVSMFVHAVLLVVLAVITLPETSSDEQIVAVANPSQMEEIENLDHAVIDPVDMTVFSNQAVADAPDIPSTTSESLDVPSLDDLGAAPEQFRLDDMGKLFAPRDDLMDRIGGGMTEGLGDARSVKARKGMIEKWGGSEGSEAAVAAALKWLAAHQERDGGWSFDHQRGPCNGRCANPGLVPVSRNGATGIALLPFLGAGQTHKEGEYKEVVERGLMFLIRQMRPSSNGGDLSDPGGGHLYSHGLAAIALCESYAMTNDPALLQPAQMSLNYIVYAQDPVGGGWRYTPKQAGDTSVVGWQLMALKSGHMAYLTVPGRTIVGANRFLDSVQQQGGAMYGYTTPGAGPATTAIGLLCRMYLGWKHDAPPLRAGIEYLHQMGPTENMYYNYYATQVMRHFGENYWEQWNARMRDRLVQSQDKRGHQQGSWYFPGDPWSAKGGRLYCTAMATMILEVYYRHLPIYGQMAAEEEFPL